MPCCCGKCKFRCEGDQQFEGVIINQDGPYEPDCLDGTYLLPEECPCNVEPTAFCQSARFRDLTTYVPKGAHCYRGWKRNSITYETTVLAAGCVAYGTLGPWANRGGVTTIYSDWFVEALTDIKCVETVTFNTLDEISECGEQLAPWHVLVDFFSNRQSRPRGTDNTLTISVGMRTELRMEGTMRYGNIYWWNNPIGGAAQYLLVSFGFGWTFTTDGTPRVAPTSCDDVRLGKPAYLRQVTDVLSGNYLTQDIIWKGSRAIVDCDETRDPPISLPFLSYSHTGIRYAYYPDIYDPPGGVVATGDPANPYIGTNYLWKACNSRCGPAAPVGGNPDGNEGTWIDPSPLTGVMF